MGHQALPFVVKPVPGKDVGIVANRKIEKGAEILREACILGVQANAKSWTQVEASVNVLSIESKKNTSLWRSSATVKRDLASKPGSCEFGIPTPSTAISSVRKESMCMSLHLESTIHAFPTHPAATQKMGSSFSSLPKTLRSVSK